MEIVASVVAEVQNGLRDIFNNTAAFLVALAAAITAIGVIFRNIRKIWRAYKVRAEKAEQFYDDFFGVPATEREPAKPGVMDRLASADVDREVMNRTLASVLQKQAATEDMFRDFATTQREIKDRMEYEMSTNGGGSLRDEVRDLGVGLNEVKDVVTAHLESMPHENENKEET